MLSVKSAFSIIVVFPSRSQTRQAGSLTNMHKKRQHKRSSKLRQEHKTQFNPPKLTLTQRVRNRRRVPANDTDQWKWLSERAGKEMSLSNSIANVYRAVLTHSAIGPRSFFSPAARPQCHLPCQWGLCHQPARTPECQERQQEALNQGHSSVGTRTAGSSGTWTEQIQCLNTLNLTPVPKSL